MDEYFNKDIIMTGEEEYLFQKSNNCWIRARSLVVSNLRSETKGSRFESGCQLYAEVSSLQ